jgi:hypothetical protein
VTGARCGSKTWSHGWTICRLSSQRASLTIDRCAFIGNQVRMLPDGRLLELVAANRQGATTATIGRPGSSATGPWQARLWSAARPAAVSFDQIVFDRVAFLENHAAFGIVPHATAVLQFAECVMVPAS